MYISNPYKLHTEYAVQIEDCNSCIEEMCDSHTRGFLCSKTYYDKCDQWENTHPGMIGKNPNVILDYYFYETGIIMVLNCFGRKNEVYASTAGIARECGFYIIAV